MKNLLFLDYETFSEADLPDVGSWEYSKHPTTEIVCAAWKFGTRENIREAKTHRWCGLIGVGSLAAFKDVLSEPYTYKVAHNAGFDRNITQNVLGVPQTIEEWICTAAIAAAHALPRDLGRACDVLKLDRRKNSEGNALINRFSKPKRPSKKDPSTRHTDREGLERFTQYCVDDVEAMVELFLALPPLTKDEREVYKLNQRINSRGVNTDRRLVKCALGMITRETKRLNEEIATLTQGKITSGSQRARIVDALVYNGFSLPNLQKDTVENALSSGLVTGLPKRLLEIRQAVSKTSNAKYVAFDSRTKTDGRLRDIQLYCGASTGRESGMGLQPHNLPKPTLEDVPEAVAAIRSGDIAWVRAIAGDVMEALSSSIRGVLIPSEGTEMFAADFNAIEARKVLWLAGDLAGLKQFESGDPYRAEAAKIFKKPIAEITDAERAFGKAVILGSGFQMGPDKFFITCRRQGLTHVTKEMAQLGISSYRKEHPKVVAMWRNLERAAITAVLNPGKVQKTNRIYWFVRGKFLYAQLPSGRRIAYFGPKVKTEMTPWGEPRPKLYHWYMDSKTHQWTCGATYGGSLTENVVQASARDLMVASQLRTEKMGYIPLFSCHDELIAERVTGEGSLEEFEKAMAVLPDWAEGMLVKVKGWTGERYRKG